MKIDDTVTHIHSGLRGRVLALENGKVTVRVGDDDGEHVWLASHIEGYVELTPDTAPAVKLDKPQFTKTEAPQSAGTYPSRPIPRATF